MAGRKNSAARADRAARAERGARADRGAPRGRPRGRPTDPAKQVAMLAAARQLFLAKGYEAVTMGEIAVSAAVSKATLYAHFADRSALLEAVIRRESERVVGEDYLRDEAGLELEARLVRFGLRFLVFLTDPERLQFERLLAGAAERYPGLAARFFEAGPGRGRATLARLIAAGGEQGALAVQDPLAAAGDLLGLWQGFIRVETTFRYRKVPGRRELRERVVRGVRLFMRLYGTPSPDASRPLSRARRAAPAGRSSWGPRR